MSAIARDRNAWRDRGKPRRYRTDPTCKDKRRFVTEVDGRAVGAVTIVESSGRTLHLWVYYCRHCTGWHLTSKNQGRRWQITVENPATADADRA